MKKETWQPTCGRQWIRFAVLGALLVLLSVLLIACGGKKKITLKYMMNDSKDGYIVSYIGSYDAEQLVIPAKYNGLPVVSVGAYAFDASPNLKSVVFEDVSKMTVGAHAFESCRALKSVVFKGKDISKLVIEKQAFEGCTALKSVSFGEGRLEELTMLKSSFGKVTELEELSFAGDENTEITIPANSFPKELSIDRLSFKGGTITLTHSVNNEYVVSVKEMNLRNANLESSYVNIFVDHLTVSGSSLSVSNIGHIEIENSASHKYFTPAKTTGIARATFAEGFDFEAGIYEHYYTKGIFNIKYYCLPYAAEIYLPASVTSIPANFFGNEGECTVFYNGTLEQWNKVTVAEEGNANYVEDRVAIKTAENNEYTVQFKGADGAVLADPVSVDYGSTVTEPSITVPNGSVLTGWYLDTEMNQEWRFDYDQVTQNITLYACFVSKSDLEKTEVLTYEGFERSDHIFTMQVPSETSEISLDAAFTVSPYATWSISRDETCADTVVGKIMLQPGENVYYLRVTSQNGVKTSTYTLRIYREKLYTVIYQPQNGEADVELLLKKDSKLENKQFTKIGYRFNGWYLNGEKVDFETFKVNYDCTLVADWRPLQYTISFAADTGVAAVSAEYGALRGLPVPASREQYAFGGWTDGAGNLFADADGKMLKPYSLLHDVTLYPVWNAINYNITYKGVEGLTNKNPSSYTSDSATIMLQSVSRTGYEFIGWFNGDTPVSMIPAGSKGHLSLEARWKPITYTVTYLDTLGASLVGLPTSFTVESNTMTLSDITVPNYTFKGWYKTNGQRVTAIAAGSHKDLVLYARFAPEAYTVTYKNLFDAVNVNPVSYTIEDADITLDSLKRPWYSFTGWYSDEACTQRVTEIDTAQGKAVTLYAGWELASYEAKYYVDGKLLTTLYFTYETRQLDDPELPVKDGYVGKWSAYSIAPETLHIYAEYSFKPYFITYKGAENHGNPTEYCYDTPTFTLKDAVKNGYRFIGWFDESGKKVTEIAKGTTGDLTLTARFELAEYSITYENVHGVDTSAFPSSFTMESAAVKLPTSVEIEGCTFKGWTWNGKKVAEIPAGTVGDVVLKAEFDLTQFIITYLGDEGNHGNPVEYNYETDTFALADGTKRGYSFLGWYSEKGEKVTEIARGTTGDLTLTARFELAKYRIKYENVHGADTSKFPSSFTVESGPITLPTIVNVDGYTFNGWTLNGKRVTVIQKGTVGDITLTANLTPTVYTIILEPAGGTLSKNTFTVEMGGMLDLPVPKQTGKVFLGWFDNTGADAVQYTDEKGDAVIPYEEKSGRVLYAHWAVVVCNVTFETNGGESVAAKQFAYGSAFDSEIVTQKDGAVFDGWYTVDGSIEYTSTTLILGDVDLHAKWVESTPISTAAEFLAIAQNPAGNYYLTDDINLKGNFWTPIESFTGKLDGRGYTVKNFIISSTSLSGNFGMIYENSGVIENLNLLDYTFNVTASTYADNAIGVLVGTNKGTISNCTLESGGFKVTCTMSGTSKALSIGGLVGMNEGIVTECSTLVNMDLDFVGQRGGTPYYYIGGLVGYNIGKTTYSSAQLSITVSSYSVGYRENPWTHYDTYNHPVIGGLIGCNYGAKDTTGNKGQCYANYANADLSHTSSVGAYAGEISYLGGLVGLNLENGRIEACYSNGTIGGGAISGSALGGLVAQNDSLSMIVSCYSTVDITADKGGDVGGLVGYNAANVQNCYAIGDVISTVNVDIGALVGENASAGTVFKCYSSGDVTAPGEMCGFFVGRSSGILNKCYYLRGTSLLVNGVYKTHVVEYETVQGLAHGDLWSREFLVDQLYWDEEGWAILINEDPILEWELAIDHSYEITVIEPTCEDFGYSLYICNDCPRFFVRDFVQPYGHARAEVRIFEPTCTAEGYTMFTCHRCDEVQTVDHQDPLGHNWQHIKRVAESCTVDGYDLYECARCEEEKRDIIPAAHKPITSLKGVPAVCVKHISEAGIVTFETTEGYTDEISCSVCNKVLDASKVIPPHSFEVTNTNAPTCTEAGYGIYTCKHCGYAKNDIVPALGHVDVNEDVRCDTCGELCGSFDSEKAIHITTVEQLIAVSRNLNGTYILDADLNLAGITWTPIGTERAPFTGFFYGNGHKICNLSVTNAETGGIFGYSRGVINGLTLNEMTVDLLNVNSVVGGIVAHNEGLVINCSLTGSVRVTMSTLVVIDTVVKVRESYEIIVGGLIGENVDTGTVKLCSNSAIIETNYTAISDIQTPGPLWTYVTRDHLKTAATLLANEVFGGLVGRNNGMITDCTVSGRISRTVNDPIAIVTGGKGGTNHRIGYASTALNAFYGTVAGINAGTISGYECTKDISGRIPEWEISKNNSTGLISAFNQQFFGYYAECHYYSDEKTGSAVGMNYPYGVVTN